jgi:ubiquinol-cytochrome c reductase cytochrome c1 subunit
VKAEAASWTVPGIDPNTGEDTTRPGTPTDYFPKPFANDIAARAANHNAVPPDLSLMAKAREGGAAYVHSLLTGYTDATTYKNADGKSLKQAFPDFETPAGLYFNPYFANLNLAMPPPLTSDGQVTYADGTPATVDQMAKDVSAFLVWTAEPTLGKRHQTGWPVLGFLLFATVLAYLSKKQIWASAKAHRKD